MLPSARLAWSGSIPAARASLTRRFWQASNSADPALPAPKEPPDPADCGKSVSPSSIRTLSIGSPSISAAIWVNTV